jgi:hypothetical protein
MKGQKIVKQMISKLEELERKSNNNILYDISAI